MYLLSLSISKHVIIRVLYVVYEWVKYSSMLLCVLELPRVDNCSTGTVKHGAQLGTISLRSALIPAF
jgi:hypothetical protein